MISIFILLITLLFSAVMLILILFLILILGENLVAKFPKSLFTTWWRRNVVGEDEWSE